MGKLLRNAAGIGAWMLALAFGFGSSAWPEYIKPHPYAVITLGIVGAILLIFPFFHPSFWKGESGKPHIVLTAENGSPFTLVHLSGGVAQHIQVEPIQSALGKNIWVRFGGVDVLSAAKPEAHPSFRLDLHGFAKRNNDMGLLGAALFSGDARGCQTVDYPITISFNWNGKRLVERQVLTWHYATKTLTSGAAK
jgi:hypothetical protein